MENAVEKLIRMAGMSRIAAGVLVASLNGDERDAIDNAETSGEVSAVVSEFYARSKATIDE